MKNDENSEKNSAFGDLISIAEAARIRGVTHGAIQGLIRRGKLSVIEIGGRKYLSQKEVEEFEPEAAGRPKKQKRQ